MVFIKQLNIQGFKSYKEQTVIEEFSAGTNVIVGRNGSGKSNFFAAIRFVLGDAYTMMGREERQALLHEGSGSAVMSAYVEIIFDNSDNRFPTGKSELYLRRTIGLKKDEYSLDKKNATKQDIISMLETAGFSKSNPYYIVPQGRVTALTNKTDAGRLTILKEVAGTQVYEQRKEDSQKLIKASESKLAEIDNLLESIQDRLSELEEEKEELRGFQEKDKQRRCLEYAYYNKTQTILQEKLDQIEEQRSDGSDEYQEQLVAEEKAIADLDEEISALTRQMELLKLERHEIDEDRREAAKSRAKTELQIRSLVDSQATNEQGRARHQQELKAVKKQIAANEKELQAIIPEYTVRQAKEFEIKQNLDTADTARVILTNKQGRISKFKDKTERDNWLKSQIKELNATLGVQKANRMDTDEEVRAVQTEIQTLDGEISGLRERLEGWSESRQALTVEVSTAKEALDKLYEQRKSDRREEDKLNSEIKSVRQERDKAQKDLSHAMDGDTAKGLATVRRLKREHNIEGAYGTLAELLEVPDTYRVAVEQTAGNSLFHYIVDNENTATSFVEALQKEKGGRVTFMPLTKLRTSHANLPKSKDAIPLIEKLKFDKKFKKAFDQVFGKTVLCPNLSLAAQYARSHDCNAITLDGDTTNKRGAMTGGFIDTRRSRLAAVHALNKWQAKDEELTQEWEMVKLRIEELDKEITKGLTVHTKLDSRVHQFEGSHDAIQRELREKVTQLDTQKKHLAALQKRLEKVQALLKDHDNEISAFEAELATDFKKALTAAEEKKLEQLNKSVQDLRKAWNEARRYRQELEGRKQELEVDLDQNLRPKLDQLNSEDIEVNAVSSSGSLKEAQKELKRIIKASEALDARLSENEQQVEDAETKIAELEKEKAESIEKQKIIQNRIKGHKAALDRNIAVKAVLTASMDECLKNIRDLGVLPEEAFKRYVDTDNKVIQSKLKKVNDALKKYKHVNKKAFEEYSRVTDQQNELKRRRKEQDVSHNAINELIEVLDTRKDEAIERTFKQVSREFATIFERLVPAGRGRLIIQRKTDQRERDEEDSEDEQRGRGVENYTGVGISVSFNSKHDDQQRIQQLSGGQKSLCALTLIFAIQQCDPAPFYLFDEIDANLDAQYRTAVAQMLREISASQSASQEDDGEEEEVDEGGEKEKKQTSGQFICTTFRPEMVLVADKCYGVTFHNKTSGIDVVSQEEALDFVEDQVSK